jgi:DNA processing protein
MSHASFASGRVASIEGTESCPTMMQMSIAEALGTLTDEEKKNAPKTLYFRGNRAFLDSALRVSVIGSRKASAEGLKRARSLARSLVAHGVVVVSGLAQGIDTAAHMAALEAGGETIAVIGTPLDQYYPATNKELQRLLGREQLLISQFPTGAAVAPKNFPIRNRTMALLTDATVIVEAGEKSGTLHQARETLRLGRALFLMESLANDTVLSWPRELIGQGAQILTRDHLSQKLANLPSLASRKMP